MGKFDFVRVNVAGKEYRDSGGNLWYADKAYVPGGWGCVNLPETDVLNTCDIIKCTNDRELFQSIRMGEEVIYGFDVPKGMYQVRIFFAEIYWESDSAEQQEVYLGKKKVLKNFNIYDDVGHDKALERTFKVNVTDSRLDVRFIGCSLPMHSGARVCAIEIMPVKTGSIK